MYQKQSIMTNKKSSVKISANMKSHFPINYNTVTILITLTNMIKHYTLLISFWDISGLNEFLGSFLLLQANSSIAI